MPAIAGLAVLAVAAGVLVHRHPHPSAEAALQAWMTDSYGPYDQRLKFWYTPPEQAESRQVTGAQICARRDVTVKGRPLTILAVCMEEASLPSGDTSMSSDHEADLFVLAVDDKGEMEAVAKLDSSDNHGVHFGGDTHLNDIDIVRLGHDFYGFMVHSTYYAMGYDVSGASIEVPRANGIVEAFNFELEGDNDNTEECGERRQSCQSFKREIHVDESHPDAMTYPVEIWEVPDPDEPARGRVAKVKRHRLSTLHFDAAHARYVATPEFNSQPF